MRNLGHAAYFKVRKVKPNTLIEAKPHKLVRIFFTHPECVKHSPMRENWELEGKDKRNINKCLGQYIGKLDSKLDIPEYEGMTLYSFLILLADKAYRGYGPDFSNIDREIIERSKQDPMFVGKDFISIYYPKPDYSKMEYIN